MLGAVLVHAWAALLARPSARYPDLVPMIFTLYSALHVAAAYLLVLHAHISLALQPEPAATAATAGSGDAGKLSVSGEAKAR